MRRKLFKALRVTLIVLGVLTILVITAYQLLRLPKVQTYLTQKIASNLSERFETRITVGGVDVEFIKKIVLEEVYVEDQQADTLLFVNKLKIDISGFRYRKRIVKLGYIGFHDCRISVSKNSADSTLNFNFLLDGFKSNESGGRMWDVRLNRIIFERVKFDFKDGPAKMLYLAELDEFNTKIDKIDFEQQRLVVESIDLTGPKIEIISQMKKRDTIPPAVIQEPKTSSDTAFWSAWNLLIGRLDIVDGAFRYDNENKERSDEGIDFNYMDLDNLVASFTQTKIFKDTIATRIQNLAFNEVSGFEVEKLSTNVLISSKLIECDDLHLRTAKSLIENYFSMSFKGYDDFQNFITKVKLKLELENTIIAYEDLHAFYPDIDTIGQDVTISGIIKGRISNINAKNLLITTPAGGLFKGKISMNGLPNFEETFIDIKVEEVNTFRYDIITLLPNIKLPQIFNLAGKIKFKGRYTGFYTDFVAFGDFNTSIGNISSDVNVKVEPGEKPGYSGSIKLERFDLGRLLQAEQQLGNVNLDLNINGSGIKLSDMDAVLKGNVSSIEILDYTYRNVSIDGRLQRKNFAGDFVVKDEFVDLDFEGQINFNSDIPLVDFKAVIAYADLKKLNLLKDSLIVSSSLAVNFKGKKLDDIQGSIIALNTSIIKESDTTNLEYLRLVSTISDLNKSILLNSDVANGRIDGKFNWSELSYVFSKYLNGYFTTFKLPEEKEFYSPVIALQFNVGEDLKILETFLPDVFIPPNLRIKGYFNYDTDSLGAFIQLPEYNLNDITIHDIEIDISGNKSKLAVDLTAGKITERSNHDELIFNDFTVYTKIANDTARTSVRLATDSSEERVRLNGLVVVDGEKYFLDLHDSYIAVANQVWDFSQARPSVFEGDEFHFYDLTLGSKLQKIILNGVISEDSTKIMMARVVDVKVEELLPIFHYTGYDFSGKINGLVKVSGIYSKPSFYSELKVEDMAVGTDTFGLIDLTVGNREKFENFVINASLTKDDKKTLFAFGEYRSDREENNFSLGVSIQEFEIAYLENFLNGIVSDMSGEIEGDLFLEGSLDKPVLKGALDFKQVGVTIDYLNTHYQFSNSFLFEENWIDLNNLVLFDSDNNEAMIDVSHGRIIHDHLKDFVFDIEMIIDDFELLNTGAQDNDLFYGTASATGIISLKGAIDEPEIHLAIKTEQGTNIAILIADDDYVSKGSFITFIQKNPLEEQEEYKVNRMAFQFNCELEVTPETNVQIIFEATGGDYISCRGLGNVRLEMNRAGDFNMYGLYTIEEGEYEVTFENVLSKTFELKEASTIQWAGEAYNAEMDIAAVYKLKISTANLLLYDINRDSISSTTKREKVECHLLLKGSLLSPDISFKIFAPNSDAIVQAKLRSIEADEQQLNLQVFSLLVLNRFAPPPNQMGVAGGYDNSAINRSVSDFLSGQLNRLITDESIDIGIQYQTYTFNNDLSGGSVDNTLTQKELQLYLTKKLFNDRLVIDVGGNFYFGNTSDEEMIRNLAGDFTIEYLISKDGKLRAKVFNQSVNDLLLERNKYKTGIGIFYKEEFDEMSEIIAKIRKNRT
ncbi:MAG: translocation/assembly module TamB domain-containing protein [Bacteroidetes bacterium]|nr:translocation/assembly module TamB domain-containing protein [Bacteroidota bacterium]